MGLSIGIGNGILFTSQAVVGFNEITESYNRRVTADGGTVEALNCVNAITKDFVIEYLLKDDNGFLLQENGYKIIL